MIANRRILPPRVIEPGVYSGTIIDAQTVAYRWRETTDNPRGLCLRVAVEVADASSRAHVFDAIDMHNSDRLGDLLAACGIEAPTGVARIDTEAIVGVACEIIVKTIRPALGKGAGVPKSVVSQWLPRGVHLSRKEPVF